MSQKEIDDLFKDFDGQKFSERGSRKSISYQPSLVSTSATKVIDSLAANSNIFKPILKSKYKTRYEDNQYEDGALRYLKTTLWDKEHWVNQVKLFNDDFDISEHPSYTIKNVAYHLECELLYNEAREKYNSQLLREMKYCIDSKDRTADQYYTKRVLSYSTFWPPLHTKAELEIFNKRFFQLSPKQRKRLDYLMTTDLR